MASDDLLRKRKNDNSNYDDLAPEDEVDLDELVKNYNQKRKNDQRYNDSYDDDEDEVGYSKSKRSETPDSGDLRRPRTREEWEEWGRRMGSNLEQMGEKFGKKAEEWGDKVARQMDDWSRKKGRKLDPKVARNIGEHLKQFLSHPYEANYQASSTNATSDERNIAALAHGSIPLIFIGGTFSAGLATPIFFLIPLVLYFMYREKSNFVARHAMNAFAAMLMASIGWIVLIMGSAIIGVVLSIALALTVIGILAIPFLWMFIVLVILISLLIPLGTFVFSIFGIFAALSGRTFNYPYIGRWLNRRFPEASWENV
ncbi:hypothetical protein ARNL5_02377 [Anaerolineae bacterium]|nr:DUF4870 domain-containing protein [Anaerolinea sp.]MCC6974936.1 DUF4870 domain-containing protein [Anaerolineae bacterium]CAG0979845.1 hypothetical protein ARNL5_02377 [Anaerolineae bacterium]